MYKIRVFDTPEDLARRFYLVRENEYFVIRHSNGKYGAWRQFMGKFQLHIEKEELDQAMEFIKMKIKLEGE